VATAYMPLLVMVNGHVQWGQVAAGYLGLLCLGATTTAIGVWASAISRTQVQAAVLGAVVVVFGVFAYFLHHTAEPPLRGALAYIGLFNKHFVPFMEGTVQLQSLVFYPTVAYLFLLVSVRVLRWRRWR